MRKILIVWLLPLSLGILSADISNAHAKLMNPATNLFSIDPLAKRDESPHPAKLERTTTLTNPGDFFRSEDTIAYDGPNTNGIGLTGGGTLYGAVRFTPAVLCTLKSAIFYQYQPVTTTGWVFIHEAGTPAGPGEKIDSAPYTNTPGTWVRVDFPSPRVYPAGIDFWLAVSLTHAAGQYPLGCDGGPSVTPVRSFLSDDGSTWQSLPGASINRNWNIRAIVKFRHFNNDVGVDAILSPGSSHRLNTVMTPQVRVKNYATQGQTNFPVVCSIVGAGSALRYTNTVNVPPLAPGETTRVNFPSWTPTVTEICTVKMRTLLAGDENPANDRKTRTTQITELFLIEGFNDPAFPPIGWQTVIITGAYNWERFPSGISPACNPYEGEAMAAYRSYNATAGSQARLITSPINLGPVLSVCSLNFRMYHDPGYSTVAESIKVEVSVDGVNFTRVAAFRRYALTAAWVEHSVFLGSFTGTFYVGFLGYSGYGNNMYIDYVRVLGGPLPPNDVGIDAIIAPGAWHLFNTSMTPIARVKNYGSTAQTNFPVVCSIVGNGGAARYTNTQTVTLLQVGDTTRVNFAAWTPSIMELCTVRMRTILIGDQNPANDRATTITDISFLSESFTDAAFPPSGWTVYNFDGGTQMWERYTTAPHSAPACAACRYESSTLMNNDWLITPRIGPLGGNDSLTFYYRNYSSTYTDTMLVRVSTNPTVSDTVGYTIIGLISTNTNAWTPRALSLSQFAGNQVYIAFHYTCLYQFRIAVDDVEVRGNRVGIAEKKPNEFPLITSLNAPKPNPVTNGLVKISFTLSEPTKIALKVYDASGRLVKILANTQLECGVYNYTWNGKDERNERVSAGIYFYKLQTLDYSSTKKILLIE
jgi:hypothetical protein